DRIAEREDENGKSDPRPRLGGAVDVTAVEQRAHEATAPGLARGLGAICCGGVHLRPLLAAGTLPVGERSDVSGAAIIVPIGSGCSTGAASGGRSGRLSSVSNCRPSTGFNGRWRRTRSWMRAGLSSLAHSARRAAVGSCSRLISMRSLTTRCACRVDSNLIL